MKRRLKEKAVFMIFLVVTLVFFTANIISKDVYAQSDAQSGTGGCCIDAGNGQYCSNVNSASDCVSGFQSGVSCDSVPDCGNRGCCNKLEDDGFCSSNVPKVGCESQNGFWTSDPLCGADLECQPKCCIIGSEWRLDYKKNCDYYGGVFNSDVVSAGQCSGLVVSIEEGCCRYDNFKGYKFTTRKDCDNLNGEFFKNTLCKNVEGYSDAGYTSHAEAKCGPEGTSKIEDVYWYDSAGNLEDKKFDCNPDSLQSARVCGDYNNDGEYICESLDCASTWDNPVVEGDGGSRKNGESWCEYQAAVGPGLDLPGTRHFKHKCINGKEVVEECASDRSEVCVQGVIDYGGSKLSYGKCIENSGVECIYLDQVSCEDETSCIWAGRCIPMSPPGNILSSSAGDYCSEVNIELQTGWMKKCGGKWKCTGNCEAYTDESFTKFTNWCNAMGDCGAKYNLADKYSNRGVSRSGSKCDGSLVRIVNAAPGTAPCYNRPPASYFNLNNLKKAGEGLFMGETNARDLDETGGLSGRQLVAMTLNIIGNEKYLKGVDVEKLSTAGGWNMFGNVMLSAGIGVAIGVAVGAYVAGTASTSVFAKIGGAIGLSAGPFGAILGALIGALIGYLVWKFLPKLFGCPKTTKKTVSFGCGVWKPPRGGDDCEMCHKKVSEGGLLPDYKFGNMDAYICSEQLCGSLGTWCEFKQSGAEGYKCVSVDPQDVISPIISADRSVTKYYCNKEKPGDTTSCNEDSNVGLNVVSEGGREKGYEIKGEIIDVYEAAINDKFPQLVLGIKTNEESVCKYDLINKEYDEMGYEFAAEDFEHTYGLSHNITLPNDNVKLVDGCKTDYTIYVKCEDYKNNYNEVSYGIKFKLAKQPDISPPYIDVNKISPLSGSYVRYGDESVEVDVEMNEPSQCKWSNKEGVNYGEMENEFSCSGASMVKFTDEVPQSDLTREDLEGEEDECEAVGSMNCEATLTNISAGENKFYFKCQDMDGNTNTQDWPQFSSGQRGYILYGSSSNLSISETKCVHDLPDGSTKTECGDIYALNYTLKLRTDGGMNGEADCMYGYNSAAIIPFFETGSKEHKQVFSPVGGLPGGSHTINIECEDKAGNKVVDKIINFIKADKIAPRLERVYIDSNYLVLETNEKSNCKYTNILRYDEKNANDMASVDGFVHRTVVENDFYTIACKDIFGNSMPPVSVNIIGEKVTVG